MDSVDHLRQELKNLGYLSRGIERWFAHDPWSSRTFWQELFLVAAKSATLLALFVALPMTAIASMRNRPLPVYESVILFALYLASGFLLVFGLVVATTMVLKLRPSLGVDRPRALIAISLALSAVITGAVAGWWIGFGSLPATFELLAGVAFLFFLFAVATIVLSAAILSFAIYETRRIPAIHQRSRTVPISIAATLLLVLILLPSYFAAENPRVTPPPQVVVSPTDARVALVAVDGLNDELLLARESIVELFAYVSRIPPLSGRSAPERWATVGTGTDVAHHGVRSIEGIRPRRAERILQSVSRFDFVLRDIAPALRLATREPLPPTERQRDYVWELLAERGVSSASINWWATEESDDPTFFSASQERLFAESKGSAPADLALGVDRMATRKSLEIADLRAPRLLTVYLPALDIVLNRLDVGPASRVSASVAALDNLTIHIADLRARGYAVILVGLPGEGQSGEGVLASSVPLEPNRNARPIDIAPTLLALFGFPASNEMAGEVLLPNTAQQRIATYGARQRDASSAALDPEYYEKLRSLGYVQ